MRTSSPVPRSLSVLVRLPLEGDAADRPVLVGVRVDRREQLDVADALLEALLDLLVVEPVGRRVDEAAPVHDPHAAPRVEELAEARLAPFSRRRLPLRQERAAVGHALVEDGPLLVVEARADRRLAVLGHQRFVARERLLRLQHVVGEELGRRVDRRQPASDHQRRQPHLQVRERVAMERTAELERHQEVARRADPAQRARSSSPPAWACRRRRRWRRDRSRAPTRRRASASRRSARRRRPGSSPGGAGSDRGA